jgi:hypothetical protein
MTHKMQVTPTLLNVRLRKHGLMQMLQTMMMCKKL